MQNSDEDTIEEIKRIKSRIEGLVTEFFERGEPVYYLSRLGMQLGADRAKLEKITGAKFASFLRENFDYEIGSEGQHNNILFIRSRMTATKTSRLPSPSPRYQPRFWAAFAVPLVEGERRYINLGTMSFHGNRQELDVNGADVREIEARFINSAGTSGNASETVERIVAWLKEQGLDGAPFLLTRNKVRRERRSLLDAVLAALDGDQLKRVLLPMDIVKTLGDQSL